MLLQEACASVCLLKGMEGCVCVCVWECHQEACEGWQGLLRKGEMECLDTIGQREMQGARLGRNLGLGNVEEEMRRHDWGRPLNPLGQAQSLGLGQWHHGGIKIIVYVGGAWHHTRPTQRRQRALLGLHFLFVRHLEIALESRIFSAFQAGWGSGKKVMIFQGKAGPYAMMAGIARKSQASHSHGPPCTFGWRGGGEALDVRECTNHHGGRSSARQPRKLLGGSALHDIGQCPKSCPSRRPSPGPCQQWPIKWPPA